MSGLELIRAISQWSGQSEHYFDIGSLSWKQKTEVRDELVAQGFWVQNVMMSDSMQIQVAAELRRRMEEVTE